MKGEFLKNSGNMLGVIGDENLTFKAAIFVDAVMWTFWQLLRFEQLLPT